MFIMPGQKLNKTEPANVLKSILLETGDASKLMTAMICTGNFKES